MRGGLVPNRVSWLQSSSGGVPDGSISRPTSPLTPFFILSSELYLHDMSLLAGRQEDPDSQDVSPLLTHRTEKYWNSLSGNKDVADALDDLDRRVTEEARLIGALTLATSHTTSAKIDQTGFNNIPNGAQQRSVNRFSDVNLSGRLGVQYQFDRDVKVLEAR